MRLRSVLVAMVVIFGLTAVARAQTHPEDTIDETNVVWQSYGYDVYPTGDPDTDKANIQWAIDHVVLDEDGEPGRVLLKSHLAGDETSFQWFDFGPSPDVPVPGDGDVLVCNDVVLEGEIREDIYSVDNTSADDPLLGRSRMTEIRNGWANLVLNWWLTPLLCDPDECPACCDAPYCDGQTGFVETFRMRNLVVRDATFCPFLTYSGLEFPEDAPPVAHFIEEITLENAHFVGTQPGPMWNDVWGAIIHTDFTQLTLRDVTFEVISPDSDSGQLVGLAVTESLTAPWEGEPDLEPIGPLHLEIVDSDFRVASGSLGSYGIVLFNPIDAIVTDNTIEAGVGIAALIRNHGTIADNEISARKVGFMAMAWDPLPEDADLPPSDLSPGVTVRDNNVAIDDSASFHDALPTAGVLGLYSFHPEGPSCAMTSTVGAVFEANVFAGDAEYGVYFGDVTVDGCEELVGDDLVADASMNNRFVDNDFVGLSASVAQVYLGEGAWANAFETNLWGSVGESADAGVVVLGDDNTLSENVYTVEGWPVGVPLWWFADTSSGNVVEDPVLPECVDAEALFVDEGTGNELIFELVCSDEAADGCSTAPTDARSSAALWILAVALGLVAVSAKRRLG